MAAMSLRTRLVLEITPPREPAAAILLRRARALAPQVRVINVIQRADRWSSLEASALLADAGMTPVWHLATRGRSRAEIQDDLARAAFAAIPRVLCLRGDHAADDVADGVTLRECVGLVRDALPEARVGVTLNPYVANERVAKNLFGKLEAGAHFVQTQPIFEAERLRPYAESIRSTFPDVEVLPMVMPLPDEPTAARIAERLRIDIPKDAIGWNAFAASVHRLSSDPLYAGLALMTPRMDVDPDTEQLLRTSLATTPYL